MTTSSIKVGIKLQGDPLTRKELVQHFAKALQPTTAQTKAFFALLAETAVETRAKGVFVFPGMGRLLTVKRKIRLGRSRAGKRGHIRVWLSPVSAGRFLSSPKFLD